MPAIKLDPLTVVDDKNFVPSIAAQKNAPTYLGPGLEELYSQE